MQAVKVVVPLLGVHLGLDVGDCHRLHYIQTEDPLHNFAIMVHLRHGRQGSRGASAANRRRRRSCAGTRLGGVCAAGERTRWARTAMRAHWRIRLPKERVRVILSKGVPHVATGFKFSPRELQSQMKGSRKKHARAGQHPPPALGSACAGTWDCWGPRCRCRSPRLRLAMHIIVQTNWYTPITSQRSGQQAVCLQAQQSPAACCAAAALLGGKREPHCPRKRCRSPGLHRRGSELGGDIGPALHCCLGCGNVTGQRLLGGFPRGQTVEAAGHQAVARAAAVDHGGRQGRDVGDAQLPLALRQRAQRGTCIAQLQHDVLHPCPQHSPDVEQQLV